MMWGHGLGWLGILWMVVVWGALVAVVAWAVRGVAGLGRPADRTREILRDRYARGEIDREELEERLRELERM